MIFSGMLMSLQGAQPGQPQGTSLFTALIPFILVFVIFYLLVKLIKMQSKTLGIILCVLGGAVGVWVFTRLTSLAGKLHSWEPPFTEYETTTIIGGAIAVLLIIVGLISLTKKKEPQSDFVKKDEHVEKVIEKTEAEEIETKKVANAKRDSAVREEYEEYKKKRDDDFLKH